MAVILILVGIITIRLGDLRSSALSASARALEKEFSKGVEELASNGVDLGPLQSAAASGALVSQTGSDPNYMSLQSAVYRLSSPDGGESGVGFGCANPAQHLAFRAGFRLGQGGGRPGAFGRFQRGSGGGSGFRSFRSRRVFALIKAMKKGFTLVELVGALVIIGILVSMVLVATGNSRDRALQTRIAADMEAINSAKGLWVLDHNGAAFPSDEPGRFDAIRRYLEVSRSFPSMSDFEAPGVGLSHQRDWNRAFPLPLTCTRKLTSNPVSPWSRSWP